MAAGASESASPGRGQLITLAILLPATGTTLGVGAILVSRAGTGDRPVLSLAVILLGAAAGLAPVRYGLPLAIILAGFLGFEADFAGRYALYWNEAFALAAVGRSLIARGPSRRELAAAATVVLVFAGYVASGTSLRADLWGLKVLFTSVAIGWAIARLSGKREWNAVYYGLATLSAGSLILGIWQRSQGVEGLATLGLEYGDRIREVSGGGAIRIFGGFTSAAPLSYTLAITFCAWIALFLGGSPDRRIAVATAWVPVVSSAGIFLAVDRTAIAALVAAVLVLALAMRNRVLLLAGGATTLIAVGVIIFSGSGSALSQQHLRSSALARVTLWEKYLADFKPFGAGPATAGSAYHKVAPADWDAPLRVPHDWDITFDRIIMDSYSEPYLDTSLRSPTRLAFTARVEGIGIPRRLTVRLGTTTLLDRVITESRDVPIAFRVPAHRPRSTAFVISATRVRPPVPRAHPVYRGRLLNVARNPSVERNVVGWHAVWQFNPGTEITRDATFPRFGNFALRVSGAERATPTKHGGGVYYGDDGNLVVRSGRRYTASAYLRAPKRHQKVYFTIVDPGGDRREITSTVFELSRTWRRYSFTYTPGRTSSTVEFLVKPRVRSESSPQPRVGDTFFLDGFQFEQGETATPYCDGSVLRCAWRGTPHGSRSSRAGSTTLADALAEPPHGTSRETIRVASTKPPMPQRTPFRITIGAEELEILSIVGATRYRVARGIGHTAASAHPRGATVWATLGNTEPERARVSTTPPGPALRVTDLSVSGLPTPRTPAERIWNSWFKETPAALEGSGPGLVDNLYVSWIFQYGLLGVLLCLLWLRVLLQPAFRRPVGSVAMTATLVGGFLVFASSAVAVWEESPTDFFAALFFALAVAESRAATPFSHARGFRRHP